MSPLQRIITTPGLQHIAEEIFANLNHKSLMKCRKINNIWEDLVKSPWVLYKACIQKDLFSLEQEQKWKKIIQKLNHSIFSAQLIEVLTQIHSGKVTDESERIIFHGKKCPFLKMYVKAINEGNSKIVEILAPLMDNPNVEGLFSYRNGRMDEHRRTPIHIAAIGGLEVMGKINTGHLNIIKIIAPLTDNPITHSKGRALWFYHSCRSFTTRSGNTPIHGAALAGSGLEMIKLLVSLTN